MGAKAPGWYFGAGELCMTAADLAKWDQAFFAKILAPKSYDEFTREVKLKNGKETGLRARAGRWAGWHGTRQDFALRRGFRVPGGKFGFSR